jgi:hypothetical protein
MAQDAQFFTDVSIDTDLPIFVVQQPVIDETLAQPIVKYFLKTNCNATSATFTWLSSMSFCVAPVGNSEAGTLNYTSRLSQNGTVNGAAFAGGRFYSQDPSSGFSTSASGSNTTGDVNGVHIPCLTAGDQYLPSQTIGGVYLPPLPTPPTSPPLPTPPTPAPTPSVYVAACAGGGVAQFSTNAETSSSSSTTLSSRSLSSTTTSSSSTSTPTTIATTTMNAASTQHYAAAAGVNRVMMSLFAAVLTVTVVPGSRVGVALVLALLLFVGHVVAPDDLLSNANDEACFSFIEVVFVTPQVAACGLNQVMLKTAADMVYIFPPCIRAP